jgi:hypothetical protein
MAVVSWNPTRERLCRRESPTFIAVYLTLGWLVFPRTPIGPLTSTPIACSTPFEKSWGYDTYHSKYTFKAARA